MAERKPRPAPEVEDEAPVPTDELCPHDGAQLVQHGPENPHKAGAWHCSECGCCFLNNALRDGHAGCAAALAQGD